MAITLNRHIFVPLVITATRIYLLAAPSEASSRLGIKLFYFSPLTVSRLRVVAGIQKLSVSAISQANPTVVTTTTPHGLITGDTIEFRGSNSTATIDGTRTVTVISPTTFSVPVNVTVAGTAAEAVTIPEEVIGALEPELTAGVKSPVNIGNGAHLVAVAPVGKSLFLVTTVSTTTGGGCMVVSDLRDKSYSGDRFGS